MRHAQYQLRAIESGLSFEATDDLLWFGTEDHPNITSFRYRVIRGAEDDQQVVGVLSGYRIAHNWSASDHELLDQADALDGDVLSYTTALVEELRAIEVICEEGNGGANLSLAQHVSFVRHLEPPEGDSECPPAVWADCVACLLLMDAPKLMLVDPRVMPDRRNASGELLGRGRMKALQALGLSRMMLSPYVWGWDIEFDETWMDRYEYDELVQAARDGRLGGHGSPG